MQGLTRQARTTVPMSIVYRPAQLSDLAAASIIRVTAINDLNQHHGFGDRALSPAQPDPFFAFSLREEPKGFWVAESAGEVIGFSLGWVRGRFWFLACLFILPTYQGKGVGRHLLEKALAYGSEGALTNHALVTQAYNPSSISLYMRCGMYPREPLYAMRGERATLGTDGGQEALEYTQARPDQDSLKDLSRVDEHVLGFPRKKHHQYLLSAPGASGHLFRKNGITAGYAYVWADGRVGPLAVTSAPLLTPAVNIALRLAAAGDRDDISIIIPGSNERAVSIALGRGMRISYPFLLMSAHPFGNWECYLFHSPALL